MKLFKIKLRLFKCPYLLISLIILSAINFIRVQYVGRNIDRFVQTSKQSLMKLQTTQRNDILNFQTTTSIEKNKPTKNLTDQIQNNVALKKLTNQERPIYIVWSRWRRGSSFFGKLLSYAKSKTFYSYEPLHALGLRVFHETDMTTRYAMKFLHDIMTCQYQNHEYMMNYFVETKFYFFYNPLTKRICDPAPTCNITVLLNRFCDESKMMVIKLLRLSLKYGNYLLNKYPQLKIIYLSRDPRGTMKSRSRLMWCLLTKDCHDPSTECKFLQDDLDYAKQFLKKYPDRFLFLRYEDLSLNTESAFKSIWEGLGQKFTSRVRRLINKHTTNDLENGIYGLKKDSKKRVFSWRSSLDFKTLSKIQTSCVDPMKELGYYQFINENDYENANISSMESHWKSVLNRFGENEL